MNYNNIKYASEVTKTNVGDMIKLVLNSDYATNYTQIKPKEYWMYIAINTLKGNEKNSLLMKNRKGGFHNIHIGIILEKKRELVHGHGINKRNARYIGYKRWLHIYDLLILGKDDMIQLTIADKEIWSKNAQEEEKTKLIINNIDNGVVSSEVTKIWKI